MQFNKHLLYPRRPSTDNLETTNNKYVRRQKKETTEQQALLVYQMQNEIFCDSLANTKEGTNKPVKRAFRTHKQQI